MTSLRTKITDGVASTIFAASIVVGGTALFDGTTFTDAETAAIAHSKILCEQVYAPIPCEYTIEVFSRNYEIEAKELYRKVVNQRLLFSSLVVASLMGLYPTSRVPENVLYRFKNRLGKYLGKK